MKSFINRYIIKTQSSKNIIYKTLLRIVIGDFSNLHNTSGYYVIGSTYVLPFITINLRYFRRCLIPRKIDFIIFYLLTVPNTSDILTY